LDKLDEHIILGIDPGTNLLGYCVLSGFKNTVNILTCGVIKLPAQSDHYSKIHLIYKELSALIRQYKPIAMAVEAPFFGKNVQSMLKLGRAQGAAIIAGVENGLEVVEYSPKSIKQSLTGNGNASKEMVSRMITSIHQVEYTTNHHDESDAIAVAICHYYNLKDPRQMSTGSSYKNWKDYVATNKDRTSGRD
jgi:crossover junction endodeoxyribonuclease RuvC